MKISMKYAKWPVRRTRAYLVERQRLSDSAMIGYSGTLCTPFGIVHVATHNASREIEFDVVRDGMLHCFLVVAQTPLTPQGIQSRITRTLRSTFGRAG